METYNDLIANKLSVLISRNIDAERGFCKAAEIAGTNSISSWFRDKANERGKFNQEIKREMASIGKDFDGSASFKGDLYRSWMELQALFVSDNDEQMIQEALSGEKTALE